MQRDRKHGIEGMMDMSPEDGRGWRSHWIKRWAHVCIKVSIGILAGEPVSHPPPGRQDYRSYLWELLSMIGGIGFSKRMPDRIKRLVEASHVTTTSSSTASHGINFIEGWIECHFIRKARNAIVVCQRRMNKIIT